MISIEAYLENVLDDFSEYIESEPQLCELKNVNFNAGGIPDYTNKNIEQLYLLRYAYAYSFEYKSMYDSLFDIQKYENRISVASIGCGSMIDYWSLAEALKERGKERCIIKYKGIDVIDWDYKLIPREKDDVSFIHGNAESIFDKAKSLNSDVYIFPKSISEFSSEEFDVVCNCFAEKPIVQDTFFVLISLRSDEASMERDMERSKKLITAICKNGYSTKDKYHSFIHYKDKSKGIRAYDHKFVYPNDAVDLIANIIYIQAKTVMMNVKNI